MNAGHDATAEGRAHIDRLIAVVDRLRSPGGCPWDAEQTHASLAPFCLEEAYEAVAAIESADSAAMRDELGDVLLQVVIHARVSQDEDEAPFTFDDVARSSADKLIRRHPHVFDEGTDKAVDAADSHRRWDRIKAGEAGRTSAFDGIPLAQGALARAAKILSRAERAGLLPSDDSLDLAALTAPHELDPLTRDALGLLWRAQRQGADLESSVRRATSALEASLRALETEDTAKND